MAANYNGRVLDMLRGLGYTAEVVERWDAYTKRRHDLFGVIDILAVGRGETIAIQVTSRGNMASRRTKMHESPVLAQMLEAGWSVQLWGYDKPDHRGQLCQCPGRTSGARDCKWNGHRWRLESELVEVPA